jgi:hypothetical protein
MMLSMGTGSSEDLTRSLVDALSTSNINSSTGMADFQLPPAALSSSSASQSSFVSTETYFQLHGRTTAPSEDVQMAWALQQSRRDKAA